MPPLYYMLLHYWMLLVGDSPLALRWLSVAVSLLVVALTAAIGTRAFTASAAMWAALFAALAPFQIYHAQELRMYGLLGLGLLIYVYGVLRLNRSRPAIALVAVALGTAIALYAHNLAFLTLLAGDVYFFWKRAWRELVRLVATQCVGGLAFVPWLLYVPGQLAKIQHAFWTQPPGLADVLQMLVVLTTYLPLPSPLVALALFITLGTLVIAIMEWRRLRQRGLAFSSGMLIAFAILPPLFMLVLSYIIYPVFVPRGVIASSLVYYVLLAALAARASRRAQVAIGVLAALIAIGTLPFLYTSWGEWRRAPYQQAVDYMNRQYEVGDLVLHDNKLSFFPLHYYDPSLPQEFLADPPGSANDTLALGSEEAMGIYPMAWDKVLSSSGRLWFLVFETAIDEAREEGHPQGNVARLDSLWKRQQEIAFGDLRVMLYVRR